MNAKILHFRFTDVSNLSVLQIGQKLSSSRIDLFSMYCTQFHYQIKYPSFSNAFSTPDLDFDTVAFFITMKVCPWTSGGRIIHKYQFSYILT